VINTLIQAVNAGELDAQLSAIQSERQFIPKKISLMRFHTSIEESVIHSLHFNSLRLVEVVPLAGIEQALLAESDFG
jgi:hypothetical protein